MHPFAFPASAFQYLDRDSSRLRSSLTPRPPDMYVGSASLSRSCLRWLSRIKVASLFDAPAVDGASSIFGFFSLYSSSLSLYSYSSRSRRSRLRWLLRSDLRSDRSERSDRSSSYRLSVDLANCVSECIKPARKPPLGESAVQPRRLPPPSPRCPRWCSASSAGVSSELDCAPGSTRVTIGGGFRLRSWYKCSRCAG